MSHRSTLAVVSTLLCALPLCATARAQATSQAAPSGPTSQAGIVLGDSLQQMNVVADRLHRTLSSINVEKWKAPGDVRQTTQSDVDSMLRDLNDTLPSLASAAGANTSRVSPAFSVYRNVDALYDVLLRVAETAQLAGATNDARLLEDQRASLESSRTQLGAALLQAAQAQDTEVTQLRTAAPAQPPPAAPTKTVIDDGPATKSKTSSKHTHKTPPAPPPQ